jgi:L-fuculose-phosphate aldolase
MNPRQLIHPRDQIMRTMERIYRYRMTTTSGGNLSIRCDNGDVWITPARIDKGALRREDIVCQHSDGTVDGPHRPSSELPFHLAIYGVRPDLGAIVHAHPVALVAFSICRRVPDTRLFHQAAGVCGLVGFAPYALPGSIELGRNIAAAFADGAHCVILENHGVVVGGSDLQQAFERFETLEFTAKTIIKAGHLGAVRMLGEDELRLARTSGESLPTFDPPPADAPELELRRQLCDFVRRGYRQRLMISTEGSFSARVDERRFLITASNVDRHSIEVGDIVLIEEGRCESRRNPSRAARLHEAIYRRHPSVKAIVNAYPVNATAFAVTDRALDARTIPESFLFLRDVDRIGFGAQFTDPAQVADRPWARRPAALLANDGVMVAGTSILDAFDRLEVLESTAEAIINARPLGEVAPMSDAVIGELIRAFGLPE